MTILLAKADGSQVDVENLINPGIFKAAHDANLTTSQKINRMFADADPKLGTATEQLLARTGMVVSADNPYGVRQLSIQAILDGSGYAANTADNSTLVGGSAQYTLFPVALDTVIENAIAKDYEADTNVFNKMIANRQSIAGSALIQPLIDYNTKGGPMQAQAQRVAEFSEPPSVLKFGTSQRITTIPTYGIMLEFSNQALRATTLDMVGLTTARFLAVEKDSRVYAAISAVFAGDLDLNVGAVTPVTSSTYNGAATGGVLTHKAWVKFLAANRRYRKITHIICDIDVWLKIEGRTGRPGITAFDSRLSTIDPQARPMGVGFDSDVQWMIVDTAADGGPVPANTVYALDASKAITMVESSTASYSASESFALRQSQAYVMTWGQCYYRLFGNTDLAPFSILTID